MNTRAVIYARVSVAKNGQPESDSISNQVSALTKLAKKENFDLVATFQDDGITGYKGKTRSGFDALLAGMDAKDFDLILVRHHDRFERNAGDFEQLKFGAIKNGIKWMDAGGSLTDPSTSGGGLSAGIQSVIASYESRVKSERLLNFFAGAAAKGEILPPPGTFGYDDADRSKIVAEEAVLIEAAYRAVAEGRSVGGIVREWNEKKIPQRKGGKKWQYATINTILKRPRNAGLVVHRGELLEGVEGQWETIIDVETWKAVQLILSNEKRKTSPGYAPVYLSSGVAKCSICGSPMRSNTATKSYTSKAGVTTRTQTKILRCASAVKGERHASANVTTLDALVREQVLQAFVWGGDSLLPRQAGVDVNALQKAQAALSAEKVDVMGYRRDGILSPAEERIQLVDISKRQKEIEAQIETVRAASSEARMLIDLRDGLRYDGNRIDIEAAGDLYAKLADRFDDLHIEQRRRLVSQLLDITVHPGRAEGRNGVDRGKYKIVHRVVKSLNLEADQDESDLFDTTMV